MENIVGKVIVGLDYWLQWQVAVCALIILLPAVITLRFLLNFNRLNADPLKSGELWIPCWTKLNPLWLLFFRALAFVSTAFVLFQVVVALGGFAFYFYTQWTFTLVMVYFALATIISARECWTHSRKTFPEYGEMDLSTEKGSELSRSYPTASYDAKEAKATTKLQSYYSQERIDHKADFLGHLVQAIYQTCAGASMLTDLVFWCLLLPFVVPKDFRLTWLMVWTHSLNAIFLILDSALNSQPFHWYGFAYFVMWSVSYIVFQWTLHACGFTRWPYPFLELSTRSAPLWYFAMALVHIPCYGIYLLLIKAKGSIFSRMFPRAFVRNLYTTRMDSLEKKET